MASPQTVVAVALALAIAAVVFVPLSTVVASNVGTQSVTNESVTAQTGEWQEINGYDVEDSETVRWYNSTSDSYETLTEGTDYEFRYDAGEIKPLEGGTVSDGDELLVTYDYQATNGIVATVVGLVTTMLALLMLVTAAKPVMEGI